MVSLPKRVTSPDDIRNFHATFCKLTGYSIPVNYFLTSDCYGLKVEDTYVFGFVLKRGELKNFRSFQELPIRLQEQYYATYANRTADLTGYFLLERKYGLILSIYMLIVTLSYKTKYFMYSYDTSNVKLEKHYAQGKPTRIYQGVPSLISEYTEVQQPINVEVCTKSRFILYFRSKLFKWR